MKTVYDPPPPREAWSESREFSIQSLMRRCFIIAGHMNVRSQDIQYLLHVAMILVASIIICLTNTRAQSWMDKMVM